MPNPKFTNKTLAEWIEETIVAYDSDECLIWEFSTYPSGYGCVIYQGRNVGVHRLAFKLTHGRWPLPCALHTCDVRRCFNPRHIFEGTVADNNADMIRKGRANHPGGESSPEAKLKDEDVRYIRTNYVRYKRGPNSTCGLARKYGVSTVCIDAVLHRKSWKHVI